MIKLKYKKWLDKNIPDLTGKKIIITGCNSGIGFYTCLNLAYKNATIIMACRNLNKALDAKNKILEILPNACLDILLLDVSSLSKIDNFINEYVSKYQSFDVLINNAGVYHLKQTYTNDGYELVMTTNYLGAYYLTNKILPYRNTDKESRIVFTTSIASKWAKIDYNDFFLKNNYKTMKIYANSKLAISRYMIYLANKEIDNLKVVASHPGISSTNLLDPNKGGVSRWFSKLGNLFLKIFTHNANKASLSSVYVASSNKVNNKDLYGPRGLFEISGYPKLRKFSKLAYQGLDKHIKFSNDLLHFDN